VIITNDNIDYKKMDEILREFNESTIFEKMYLEKIVETISTYDPELEGSMYKLLSKEFDQDERTIRRKIEAAIKKNEDKIKNRTSIEKPTPKRFMNWIVKKVKKR
jgi:hypothetical protein